MSDDPYERIAELESLCMRLANHIYLAYEILSNLAERRKTVDYRNRSDKIGHGGTVASDPTTPLHNG